MKTTRKTCLVALVVLTACLAGCETFVRIVRDSWADDPNEQNRFVVDDPLDRHFEEGDREEDP